MHAVPGEQQVEDRGHPAAVDLPHRHRAAQGAAVAVRPGGAVLVEAREVDLDAGAAALLVEGEFRLDVPEVEVPAALALLGPAVAEGAGRRDGSTGGLVEEHRLPPRLPGPGLVRLGVETQVRRGDELARHDDAVTALQLHQKRQVGEGLHVLGEVRHLALDEELAQHHMAHGHGQRPVRPRVRVEPFVGELRRVGVVRGDHDHLLAAVAGLGHPVRVRRPRDRHVGAPQHQVGRVPPVAGLRYVRLVAEDLRGGDRQVRVPVVEGQHRRADQRHEPGAHRVRGHRHRGDRGEARHPVGPVGVDGVHVGGGRDLQGLLPCHAHQAALAPGRLVAAALDRVLGDLGPCRDGVAEPGAGLAVHLHQDAAGVRVAHPRRRVGVPGEGRAPGAAARLVLGAVRADGGVVGLLGLPRDQTVLDVHLPRARPRAVHAVRRAHHLVVGPTLPVRSVVDGLVRPVDGSQIGCRRGSPQLPAEPQQPLRRLPRRAFRCLACPEVPHGRPVPSLRITASCVLLTGRARFRAQACP